MNEALIFILVFVMQAIFNIARVFEVRWSYDIRVVPLAILTFIMSIVWIISVAYSMEGVVNGDVTRIVAFTLGSVFGRIVAVTTFKEFAIRPQVFKKVLKKKGKGFKNLRVSDQTLLMDDPKDLKLHENNYD